MSWLHAHRHDFAVRRWAIMLVALIAAASLFAIGATSLLRPSIARAEMVAPERAAALVAATSGDQATQVQAMGAKAELINAAMPFSAAPIQAARAFILPAGETLDQRRAVLCLTQAVYYEAGFEPIDGRRAVAQVVLNRMRHPAFPKSVCGVVYQRNATPVCQFSFVCDGSLDRRPEAAAWKVAEAVARAALAGHVEQSVGSATHYHADYVAPRWAPLLTKITKLGAHIFYRWPGAWGQVAAFNGRYIGEPRDPLSLRPAMWVKPPSSAIDPDAAAVALNAGPPIARAANDVGGLLDTSKGWTLNIPLPGEAGAASKAIAEQQARPVIAPQNGAPAATRVIASR
ncbi:cell wall hydrolase [Sphingomonas sp.]|uniref:cell wall hydrolase n=1 Tax=Sphingomonas sp. TaxID=28214 RepID=UPI00286A5E09|nr:cell wall hydrolase [Sphingomonas sp.]